MLFFIVNPAAKSGKGQVVWKQLETILNNQGIPYEAVLTKSLQEAVDQVHRIESFARTHPQEEITLTVVGGDGTLNGVLNACTPGNGFSMGYIPAGTGNDFCRALHLETDAARGLARILHPRAFRMLDVGEVTAQGKTLRFLVSAGMGFDAAVCHQLQKTDFRKKLRRWHLDRLSYVFSGIYQIVHSKPVNLTLWDAAGKSYPLLRTRFISIHNQPFEGGGFCFAPAASVDDGYFDICAVSGVSAWKFAGILVLSIFGKHTKAKGVTMVRTQSFRLEAERPMAAHTDGESFYSQNALSGICRHKQIRWIIR